MRKRAKKSNMGGGGLYIKTTTDALVTHQW